MSDNSTPKSAKTIQIVLGLALLAAIAATVVFATRANTFCGELQSATNQLATTRNDLAKSVKASEDLKSQLDKSTTEAKERLDVIINVSNEVVKFSKNYEDLQAEAKLTADELEKVKKELAILQSKKPPMPIRLSFRGAFFSNGRVMICKNTAGKLTAFNFKVTNPTTGAAKTFRLIVDPDIPKEFGHQEGWDFAPGDTIEVTNLDYEPLTFKVP